MPHHEPPDTIENRVYVFESLARAFVERSADDLGSKNPERRSRAIRALADLAFVSCVVADTGHLRPKAVKKRVLAALDGEGPAPGAPETPEESA
jgi:hypothetical protein